MSTLEALIEEAKGAPEPLVREALDFLRYLRLTRADDDDRVLLAASESALAKDWLSPEEDEAWKDL